MRVASVSVGSVFVGALFSWHVAVALAAPSRPALHWSRGPGAGACIDPRSLAERVEAITGPALVEPASADTSIEAHIERSASDRYEVRLTVTRGRGAAAGERLLSFTAQDCRKLDAAIAFVIAITIDPDAGVEGIPESLDWATEETPAAEQIERELAVSTAHEAPNETVVQVAPSAISPPPSAAKTIDDVPSWRLALSWIGGTGPTAAAITGGSAELSRAISARFSIAAQLMAAASLARTHDSRGHSVGTGTSGLALVACALPWRAERWQLSVCLGPELRVVRASGHGFAHDRLVVAASVAAQLDLALAYRLDARWQLTAAATPSFDFDPARIHAEEPDATPLFRMRRSAIVGVLGAAYAF